MQPVLFALMLVMIAASAISCRGGSLAPCSDSSSSSHAWRSASSSSICWNDSATRGGEDKGAPLQRVLFGLIHTRSLPSRGASVGARHASPLQDALDADGEVQLLDGSDTRL